MGRPITGRAIYLLVVKALNNWAIRGVEETGVKYAGQSHWCKVTGSGIEDGSRIEGSSLANHARDPVAAQSAPVDRAKNG